MPADSFANKAKPPGLPESDRIVFSEMPSIFVSYSSSDRAQAITVKNALTALGYESIFLDVDATGGIAGGTPWFDELSRQIRMSVAVVAL